VRNTKSRYCLALSGIRSPEEGGASVGPGIGAVQARVCEGVEVFVRPAEGVEVALLVEECQDYVSVF
jgi:hypothetical protein